MHYSVSLILRINSVTQKLVLPLHWWLPKSMLFEVAAGTLPLAYSTLQDPIPTTKDEKSSFVTYILYHSWSIETTDHFPFFISHTEVALKSRLPRRCFIKWCSPVCNN